MEITLFNLEFIWPTYLKKKYIFKIAAKGKKIANAITLNFFSLFIAVIFFIIEYESSPVNISFSGFNHYNITQ